MRKRNRGLEERSVRKFFRRQDPTLSQFVDLAVKTTLRKCTFSFRPDGTAEISCAIFDTNRRHLEE